jgi:hypothetical protein
MKLLSKFSLILAFILFFQANLFSAGLKGTYTVGTGVGQSFTSLSAAFQIVNSLGLDSNTVLKITSNIVETSAASLNQWANTQYPLTIISDGGNWTVSGNIASNGLIVLNSADKVTIDGRVNGAGNFLTFNNTNTTSANAVIRLISLGSAVNQGSSTNMIRNCNIIGGQSAYTSPNRIFGIYASGTGALGLAANLTFSGNNNDTVMNCVINKVNYGIFFNGVNGTPNTNLVFSGNTIGDALTTNTVSTEGIVAQNASNVLISKNVIFNMTINPGEEVTGIDLAGANNNATIIGNHVYSLKSTTNNTGTYGIEINTDPAASGILVANNEVSDITTAKNSTTNTAWNPFGIRVTGSTGAKIYNNSVNMYGTQPAGVGTGSFTAAFYIDPSNSSSTDLRNNIFINTLDPGTGASYGMFYNGPSTGANDIHTFFPNINYNDYYANGTNCSMAGYGTTAPGSSVINIAGWRTLTTKDANSVNDAVVFIGNNDLHLNGASLADYLLLCPTLTGNTNDFDGIARQTTTMTQMGMDEAKAMFTVGNLVVVPDLTTYYSGQANSINMTINATLATPPFNDGITRTPIPAFNYTWTKNTNLYATTSSIQIGPPLLTTDGGVYRGSARILDDTIFTNTKSVVVIAGPTQLSQNLAPTYQLCIGQTGSITIGTIGTVNAYNWQMYINSVWTNVAGQTTNTLTFNPFTTNNLGVYRVQIIGIDVIGNIDTIYSAATTISAAAHVTAVSATSNVDLTFGVCSLEKVVFTANANGSVASYQWQYQPNATANWVNISTNQTYVIAGATTLDIGNYRAIIYPDCDASMITNILSITTVWPVVTFIQQPEPQVKCEGDPVLLSVNVTGTVFGFQWMKDGRPIDPRSNPTAIQRIFKIDSSTFADNGVYTCVATVSDCGGIMRPAVSDPALVYVNRKTQIIKLDVSPSTPVGGTITLEVYAYVTDPASVKWYKGPILLADNNWVSGAKSSLLTINEAKMTDGGNNYSVIVSGLCSSDTVKNITVTVSNPTITITGQPTNSTGCAGDNAAFTVSATFVGGTQLSYQWLKDGSPLTDGGSISGSTTANLIITNMQPGDAGQYNVIITLVPTGITATSNAATLTVNTKPSITQQPPATLGVTAGQQLSITVAADGSAPLAYQWYEVTSGLITGATSATYTKDNATTADAGSYYCKVTNLCGQVQSDNCVVTVAKKDLTDVNDAITGEMVLLNNVPNPFNDNTTIQYYVPTNSQVRLVLTDIYGREIAVMFNGTASAGFNSVAFNAAQYNLASGTYYYTLQSAGKSITKTMLLVK